MTAPVPNAPTALTSYQRKLFVFLSVATLFEGYDFMALSQILPNVQADMHLDETGIGRLVSFINLGTVVAFALVGLADRWGRKRLLTLTIVGYTLCTFVSGFAPNVWALGAAQFLARMFLIAEWATSMVYAAEEFPAERRGMVIGVIQACSSLGAIVCAGVVPMLLRTAYGWRSVYFVGIVPLVILMVARRDLRESSRFTRDVQGKPRVSRWHIWSTPHKTRILQLALIWGLTYVCTNNAVTFWKQFAIDERHLTDDDVAKAISIAAVASMPLVFYAGRLLDVVGRKKGAVIIFTVGILGTLGCYGLHGFWPLTASLILGIFGANGVLPVLNAFTSELFPTAQRADAFAWANNLLGRITYVLSPAVIGWAAKRIHWGPALQISTIGPALALVLIMILLPETKSRDLDETAAFH
jgi:MFS transporter, putative metabolite:H+ symporter